MRVIGVIGVCGGFYGGLEGFIEVQRVLMWVRGVRGVYEDLEEFMNVV